MSTIPAQESNFLLTVKEWRHYGGRTMDTWEYTSLPICRRVKRSNLMVLLAVALIIFTMTGCGTLQNGRGWGQDAICPVELKRISDAAYHAFFDLQTLIPAAGALVCIIDHYDQRVSRWATSHHPIFGSKDSASQASDFLAYGLGAETLVTGSGRKSIL